MQKKLNVVIYLTGDKFKDEAIKKYCRKNKLNVIEEFMPEMNEGEDSWNSGILDLCYGIMELHPKQHIDQIITYDLNNLFWCTYDQVAIVLMIFNIGPTVFTLKEGNIIDDDAITIKLDIKEENIANLIKFWTDNDKYNYKNAKNNLSEIG